MTNKINLEMSKKEVASLIEAYEEKDRPKRKRYALTLHMGLSYDEKKHLEKLKEVYRGMK